MPGRGDILARELASGYPLEQGRRHGTYSEGAIMTESTGAPRQRPSIPPQFAGQAQAMEGWFIAAEPELRRKNWSAAFTARVRL